MKSKFVVVTKNADGTKVSKPVSKVETAHQKFQDAAPGVEDIDIGGGESLSGIGWVWRKRIIGETTYMLVEPHDSYLS